MKIIYQLTDKEIEFLKELEVKSQPKNAWSGRMSDDVFRSKWKDEIQSFKDAALVERKDSNSSYEYWCYGLNEKGLELQNSLKDGKE